MVKETDDADGSLFSSCVIVGMQSTMSGNCFYFFTSVCDDALGVVTLQENVCQLFSLGFEVHFLWIPLVLNTQSIAKDHIRAVLL